MTKGMWVFHAIDVGQAGDPAAEVVIAAAGERAGGGLRPAWEVLAAQVLPAQSYASLAEHVASQRAALAGDGRPVLTAVDATGCGRPVVEMIRAACGTDGPDSVIGVTFTAGRRVGGAWPDVTVAKTLLVEHTETALDHGGLIIGDGIDGGGALLSEMARYVRRENGKIGAATGHDDLVCALMLAVWLADTVAERIAQREAHAHG